MKIIAVVMVWLAVPTAQGDKRLMLNSLTEYTFTPVAAGCHISRKGVSVVTSHKCKDVKAMLYRPGVTPIKYPLQKRVD